jgi:hypothetical protein
MIAGAFAIGIFGLVLTGSAGRLLLWLHRTRKVSDVTGTVVDRGRHFTSGIYRTHPVVEFTTRDGTQVRRTFRQIARPTVGRKLRIVYAPSALPDGRTRSTGMGLTFVSSSPIICSAWLLWLRLLTAVGLASIAGCIAIAAAAR